MKRRWAYLVLCVLSLMLAYWCLNTALAYGSLGIAPGFPFEEARSNADFYSVHLLLFVAISVFCGFKFIRSVKTNG